MKKLFLIMFIVVCFMGNAFAGNNKNVTYFVDSLFTNSTNVKSSLIQNITGATNSCGPTSLMFINNHFSMVYAGVKADFTLNKFSAIIKLGEIYGSIGQSYNTVTNLAQLKDIAQNDWYWGNVRRRSSSDGIDVNVEKLITDLSNDIPGIIVLDSSFPGNPVSGSHGIDHIVVIYAYQRQPDDSGNGAISQYNDHQNDRIYFYDPYYGGNGSFARGEISVAVNLAGFAYLQAAP